jgi:hypothetical protein
MLTKLEQNLIKSMINEKSKSKLVTIAADATTMKVNKSVDVLLNYFHTKYKEKTGDTKIGKSAYLHKLLKAFAYEQRALIRYCEIDPKLFDASMLDALQQFKKICRDYVDPTISDQSSAVIALLIYSSVRAYEVENGFKVDDYLDDEMYNDEDEARGLPVRPQNVVRPAPPTVPLAIIDKDLSDLFEDEPPKPVSTKFSLREDK